MLKQIQIAMRASGLTNGTWLAVQLILWGAQQGLSDTYVPLVLVVMSVVYTASAYPAGILSDRWSRRGLLGAGMVVLVLADAVLAASTGPAMVFISAALWGLHMGLTQGLLATMVADTSPPNYRGTGFGVFSLVAGLALLVASALAGLLWDRLGATTTFAAGGVFSLLTLCTAPLLPRRVVV